MMPATTRGFSASAITIIPLSRVLSTSSSVVMVSPVPDSNRFATNLRRVKGMQGLPGFKENKIGRINDVVDRSESHRFQSLLEPFGTGSDFHSSNAPQLIEGASFGFQAHFPKREVFGNLRRGSARCRDCRNPDLTLVVRSDFTGYTQKAQAISPVCGNFELKSFVLRQESVERQSARDYPRESSNHRHQSRSPVLWRCTSCPRKPLREVSIS